MWKPIISSFSLYDSAEFNRLFSCVEYFVTNFFVEIETVFITRNRHDEKGGNERLATNAAYSFCKSIALTS